MKPEDLWVVWPTVKEFEQATGFSGAARRKWRSDGHIPERTQHTLILKSKGKFNASGELKGVKK